MGYITHVRGGFLVEPHLTWQEIKASAFEAPGLGGNDWAAPGVDLRLSIVEQTVDTDEGSLVRRTSNGLRMPHIDEYRARGLVEQVQQCIDMFPGHRWPGRLECEGEDNADMWRVIVRNGRALRIEPRIVWPEGGDDQ